MLDAVTATGAGSAVDSLQYNCFSFFINASSVTTGGTVKIQGLTPAGDWVDISTTAITADGDTLAQKDGAYLQVRANLTARTDGTYTVGMVAKEGRINEAATIVSTTDLVSFWKLDEASGTRVDSFGSNDLTDNNTVGQATSLTGVPYTDGADFERTNSEYLSIADGTQSGLSPLPTDFTVSAWVKLESIPASTSLIVAAQDDYGTGTAADRSWVLVYNTATSRFQFYLFGGASFSVATANNFGAASTATWYCVCATYDSTAQQTAIQVDAGTADTASHTIGTNNSTAPVAVGGRFNNTAFDSGSAFDGVVQSLSYWSRVLSDAEITALANPSNPFYDQF